METDPFPLLLLSGLAPNPAELIPAAGAMLGAKMDPAAPEVPLLPPKPLPLSYPGAPPIEAPPPGFAEEGPDAEMLPAGATAVLLLPSDDSSPLLPNPAAVVPIAAEFEVSLTALGLPGISDEEGLKAALLLL